MATTTQIMGLKQLTDNLKKIGKLAEGNAAIAMARTGANVFKKAAKEKVPQEKGSIEGIKYSVKSNLKESIIVKQISRGPHIVYATTIRPGKKGVRYAHLVEFGTRPHPEPRKGKKSKGPMFISQTGKSYWSVMHPGAKKKPFMTPAFENNSSKALTKMAEVYNKILQNWQTGYAAIGSLYGLNTEE